MRPLQDKPLIVEEKQVLFAAYSESDQPAGASAAANSNTVRLVTTAMLFSSQIQCEWTIFGCQKSSIDVIHETVASVHVGSARIGCSRWRENPSLYPCKSNCAARGGSGAVTLNAPKPDSRPKLPYWRRSSPTHTSGRMRSRLLPEEWLSVRRPGILSAPMSRAGSMTFPVVTKKRPPPDAGAITRPGIAVMELDESYQYIPSPPSPIGAAARRTQFHLEFPLPPFQTRTPMT